MIIYSKFPRTSLSYRCNLTIKESAFTSAFETMKELEIRNTLLGSNQLINNLAKHFKHVTKIDFEDNYIDEVNDKMIPLSVRSIRIWSAFNTKFSCNCTSVRALKNLTQRVTVKDLKQLEFEGCQGTNDTEFLEFNEAYAHCISIEAREAKNSKKTVSNALIGVVVFIICFIAITYCICQRRLKNKTQWQSNNFEDCVCDAFISYAQPDWEIMETIYHRLIDDSKNLKVFEVAFNDKDFVPGKTLLTICKYSKALRCTFFGKMKKLM